MNSQQKRAWFIVALFGLVLIAYLTLGVLLDFTKATVAFRLFFLGFAGFFWRDGKRDERDKTIHRRASRAGFAASYAVFFTGCMGIWAVKHLWQHESQITVESLWQLAATAAGTAFLTYNISILFLYGRHVEAEPMPEKGS